MKDSPLSDDTLWRVIDVLDRRPEQHGKTLDELAALAARLILLSRQIAEREANNYRREQSEKQLKSMELVSEEYMAKAVVADKNKDRGIKRFREFAEVLMEPWNPLEPDREGRPWLMEYLESHRWPKGWIAHFQKLFPKWVRLKKVLSQRGRKKKTKKVLALT